MRRRKHGADELVGAMTKLRLWDKRLQDYSDALLEALMQSRGLTSKQAIRLVGEDGLDDNANIIASKLSEPVRVTAKKATAKKYGVAARTVERWAKDGPDKLASLQQTAKKLRRAIEEERTPAHPLIDEFRALENALPVWETNGDWKVAAIQEAPWGHGILWRKALLHFATRRVTLSRQLELKVFRSAQRIEKLEAENHLLRKEINELKAKLREQDIACAAAAMGARNRRR